MEPLSDPARRRDDPPIVPWRALRRGPQGFRRPPFISGNLDVLCVSEALTRSAMLSGTCCSLAAAATRDIARHDGLATLALGTLDRLVTGRPD
jgi:hypothetical protein